MDAVVIARQDPMTGSRLFFCEHRNPPWTRNLLAAGQYLRRYEAEDVAREHAGAIVLDYRDAWFLIFTGTNAAPVEA